MNLPKTLAKSLVIFCAIPLSFLFINATPAPTASSNQSNIDPYDLEKTLETANAGTTIFLKPGTYTDLNLTLRKQVKGGKIKIDGLSKVTFTGASRLTVVGSGLEISGLIFDKVVIPENSPEYVAVVSIGDFIDDENEWLRCDDCAFLGGVRNLV